MSKPVLAQSSQNIRAIACLIASMAVVGSYVALSKPLLTVMPVFILAGCRFTIAAVLMMGWLKREPGYAPLSLRARWELFVQSFFGNFLFSICMLTGVAYSSATTAGIVMAAIPAAVAVLSRFVLGERLSTPMRIAIVLSIAAVSCLQLGKGGSVSAAGLQAGLENGSRYGLGVALLLMAVFCEATYVVMAKRLSGQISPRRNSALLNAIGWALTLPLAIWQLWDSSGAGFQFATLTISHGLLLLYYSVAASVLSTVLWFTGLRHVPANQAGVYTVALPITAAGLGVGVLGEVFTAWYALALCLAVSGVVCASWQKKV